VAARAATRATHEDVAELGRLAQSMADLSTRPGAAGREKIGHLNALFHRKLIEMAGSERLTSMVSQLLDVPLSLRIITRYDQDALARSLNHHFEIVAAIAYGDADWAETVMKAHILAAWRAISSDPAT
jgi:DNA-binding GntR family transcriptional regulator